MNKKVCFKSNPIEEESYKVLAALTLLGGDNIYNFTAAVLDRYFFLDSNNNVDYEEYIPEGYTLANVDEVLAELVKPKEKFYPKWMRVGNQPDGNNLKRFVVCFYNDVYWAVGLGNDLTVLENAMIFPYTYAEDIDENAEKVERLCKELGQLERKVAEIKEQIKQLNNG